MQARGLEQGLAILAVNQAVLTYGESGWPCRLEGTQIHAWGMCPMSHDTAHASFIQQVAPIINIESSLRGRKFDFWNAAHRCTRETNSTGD